MNARIRLSLAWIVTNTVLAAISLYASWWICAGINIAAVVIHLVIIDRATRGVA